MRLNNLGYLLKEGIRSIFLHGFMSFAAVCVTVACLLIIGIFASVMYNVNIMVEDLNQTNEVRVYIAEGLSEAEGKSIETEIRAMDNVAKGEFITREQALEDFIADHGDDPAFAGTDAETLRHRVVVVLEDNALMEQTVEELLEIQGVDDVTAFYELAEGFAMIQDILQAVYAVVLAVLLVVSLLIISNTVKIGMYDRRDEIAIMKMVGATNGFIRLPFVVEGFLLGMIGAGGAFGLNWWAYNAMLKKLEEVDTLNMFAFVPFERFLVPMIVTFAAAGLFVGIVGSWTSIRKFLNV